MNKNRESEGPFVESDPIHRDLQNRNFEKDLNATLYSSITIELCGEDNLPD